MNKNKINYEYLLKSLCLNVGDIVNIKYYGRYRVKEDYLQKIFATGDWDGDFAEEEIWFLFEKEWSVE